MLVLDANILVRAVLGSRVFALLERYAPTTRFGTPDVAYGDARSKLEHLAPKRGLNPAQALAALAALPTLVDVLEADLYGVYEAEARARLRDQDDWPVLACALALDCPLWTEDLDFFGAGVATWDSQHVERYLTAAAAARIID
jgi:predicted nucleic acid-binding protein